MPRQLGDFDVDVGWAGRGGGGGGAEEGEEEPAGAGGVSEGVERCAEGGDRVDWNGHFGSGGGGGRYWSVECGLRGGDEGCRLEFERCALIRTGSAIRLAIDIEGT